MSVWKRWADWDDDDEDVEGVPDDEAENEDEDEDEDDDFGPEDPDERRRAAQLLSAGGRPLARDVWRGPRG